MAGVIVPCLLTLVSGEPLTIDPPLRLLFIPLDAVLNLPYVNVEVTAPNSGFDWRPCFMCYETDWPLSFMLPRNSNLPTPMSEYSLQILCVFDALSWNPLGTISCPLCRAAAILTPRVAKARSRAIPPGPHLQVRFTSRPIRETREWRAWGCEFAMLIGSAWTCFMMVFNSTFKPSWWFEIVLGAIVCENPPYWEGKCGRSSGAESVKMVPDGNTRE